MLTKESMARDPSRYCPENGFTLIEILVGMAVASIGMLATLEVVNLSNKANRSVSTISNFNNLVASVAMVFTQAEICKKSSLVGTGFVGSLPVDLPSITLPTSLYGRILPGSLQAAAVAH